MQHIKCYLVMFGMTRDQSVHFKSVIQKKYTDTNNSGIVLYKFVSSLIYLIEASKCVVL